MVCSDRPRRHFFLEPSALIAIAKNRRSNSGITSMG
jgi:hypothetical protein